MCNLSEKRSSNQNTTRILGGVVKYTSVKDLNDAFSFQVGAIGHIWMPRAHENLYFKTGLIFSQLDFGYEKKNIFKIPCQFEYIYPKGIIRPLFAYGVNIYYIYAAVSVNVGANIEITESLFLSAASEIEFSQEMLIVPKDLISYSLRLGLFMKIK